MLQLPDSQRPLSSSQRLHHLSYQLHQHLAQELPPMGESIFSTPWSHLTQRLPLRFFSSKGRVAALFTFVGLLAIAIFFVAFTTIVRRRRAKQIDKDVVEAAKEAPATFHSANFDDYDDSPYTGYSADG